MIGDPGPARDLSSIELTWALETTVWTREAGLLLNRRKLTHPRGEAVQGPGTF